VIAAVGFLVVRAGGARYGLALSEVREVVDIVAPRPVPARSPAVRGVMPLRQRHLSLVHLGTLIDGGHPPEGVTETAVVVEIAGVMLALEVDDVEAVIDRDADFVGAAPVGWASGVWRIDAELVTVLDLGVLAGRILETGSGDDAVG
jgi:chemotaxis signal transduction protein